MASRRKFEFGGDEGARFSIDAQLDDLKDGSYVLRGPHGKEYRLDVSGVPDEHRETAQRLLTDEAHDLNEDEVRALASGRAVLSAGSTSVAGMNGPIVRFDCTWVTWEN